MRTLRALCGLACVLLLARSATAAVPQTFSYQGKLTTDGQPVDDGAWDLVFAVYAAASGGSPLWTETQSDVVVKNGLFTVRLGSATPLPVDLFITSPRYLGFAVEGSPEMTPRTPIVSVPYAMVAGSVAGGTTNCHTCDTVFINSVGPEVFRASADTALKVIDTGTAARVGLSARIETSTSDTISAIRGVSNNAGSGKSQAASFVASSTGGGVVHGINVQTTNNSATYTSMGVVAEAKNDGAGSARGGFFEAKVGGTGEHVGVVGQSWSSSSAGNFGVKGNSIHQGTGKSYGGYFSATGGSNRYGVSSHANCNSADTAFGVHSLVQSTANGPAIAGYFVTDTQGTGMKYGIYSRVPYGSTKGTGVFTSAAINSSSDAAGVDAEGWNYGTGKAYGGTFESHTNVGASYGAKFFGGSNYGKVFGVYSLANGYYGSDTIFATYSIASTPGASGFSGPSFAGYFLNAVSDGASTLGLYSLVDHAGGTQSSYGTYSRSQNYGSTTSYAGYFLADSTGSGISYGVRPVALSKGIAAAYGVNSAVANRGTGSVYAGYFDVLNYGTGARYAVYGNSPISGYAGYFNGNVRVTGNQTVLGTKSAAVEVAPEEYHLVYSQESPECWFEDFGEGQLVNGRAHIDLDPSFMQTVTINQQNPMKVFIQLNDPDCHGTAVVRGTAGFDVVELMNGKGRASFCYRIVAKRKGFENVRLARMDGETPKQVSAQVEATNAALQADEAVMQQNALSQRQRQQEPTEEAPLLGGQGQP